MTDSNARSRKTHEEWVYVQAREETMRAFTKDKPVSYFLDHFPVYSSRQSITKFLALQEVYLKILHLQGSIIECGVLGGFSLLTWAQLSSIYEPVSGANRRIYGFDTFEGFPSVGNNDWDSRTQTSHKVGDLDINSENFDVFSNLQIAINLFDKNRFMSQFEKVEIIKGDFELTGPLFLDKHKEIVPTLLYLDFDLYQPTKKALELFVPLMPKGSIICFDEINDPTWPGETQAAREIVDFTKYHIFKSSFDIKMSYLVL